MLRTSRPQSWARPWSAAYGYPPLAELPAALQTFDKTFHRCLLYKPESAAYGCAASRNRMASILSEDHFHNEDAAYDYVEARLWRDGPVCPHCGVTKGNVGKLQGRSTRI